MVAIDQVLFYAAGVVAAVLIAKWMTKRATRSGTNDLSDESLVFLIDGGRIIDTNFHARRMLDRLRGALSDHDQLRVYLSQHFQDADRLLQPDVSGQDLLVQSRDGQIQAIRQSAGDAVRLTIRYVTSGRPTGSDVHTLRAIETELKTLRANTFAAPFLLWRQNEDGEIVWANQAYLNTAHKFTDADASDWPLPVLFPALKKLRPPVSRESRRISTKGASSEPEAWYDCHISPVGDSVLLTGIPADEAVQAENRRREFTQTLTKTFAELAIGLAIFDRSRQLVLFNPALMDLTSLPTDFLTSRPSLFTFLDQLRENRVMPEPRDYRSWRASIAALEAAAADGTYSETWSLPDGQTYHVTGRPHPDGAVALLFEDISAEMSLTRHFRAELEQFQDVIDTIDDAVAVFSAAGDVTVTNRAYRDLWGIEDNAFLVGDLTEATRRWHDLSAPTPIWGDFRDFAQGHVDREEWSATVALRDGRRVNCRFSPKKGGATMAVFRIEGKEVPSPLQAAV